MQFDLFGDINQEKDKLRLHRYWQQRLDDWPSDVFNYRHIRDTTGWSMTTDRYLFARWLFSDGVITLDQYRRYFRFHLFVKRWTLRR